LKRIKYILGFVVQRKNFFVLACTVEYDEKGVFLLALNIFSY